MPLTICPGCGFEVTEGELVCPNCGFLLDEPDDQQAPDSLNDDSDSEVLPVAEDSVDNDDLPDGKIGPPIEIEDENLRRGCLIAVGVVGTLFLIIMIIMTFTMGRR